MALCSKSCMSEMAAMICMCDTPLESLLNSLIGDKFISRRSLISTWWVQPTAISVPLVFTCFPKFTKTPIWSWRPVWIVLQKSYKMQETQQLETVIFLMHAIYPRTVKSDFLFDTKRAMKSTTCPQNAKFCIHTDFFAWPYILEPFHDIRSHGYSFPNLLSAINVPRQ